MALSNEELAMISNLARKQVDIEKEIFDLEDKAKAAKERLKEVQEIELPNAMAEVQMSSFTLADGTKVSIKEDYYASIAKEDDEFFKRSRAFAWLRNNSFGALIKNQVICEFGKGEDELAQRALEMLALEGFNAIQSQNVHPMTLKAFVKEQCTKGEQEFPMDIFNAGTLIRSKVDLPKAK